MTPQPSPTPYEQLIAALDTALHMAGHIAPADLPPSGAEQSTQLAFAAAGLPDVLGVVLRGIPTLDALHRIQTTFGGEITITRRASSATGTQWTEHQLVGSVRDGTGLEVPYLAEADTDHGRLELPRRRRAATPPDMVRVPVTQLDDGGRAAEKAALDLVTASLDADLEPGALEYAHSILHPEPAEATLACLLAHTDLQPDDPTLTTAHATGQKAGA